MTDIYTPPAGLLQGRIILVTGANRGIGACAAKTFATYGATVILVGRKKKELEVIYDEIEQAGHPQPAIFLLDLGKAPPEEYEKMADVLEGEFGRLDGLLHNAAILGQLAPLELYSLVQWGKVMQVNLNAPLLLTRACLRLLKKSADASIVFTGDEVGRKGRAYWGAYGVGKFAIEGLVQILADELENSTAIRVNSLDPGPVRTALRAQAYPGGDVITLAEPEAIMPLYLYLLGPDSKGSTGQAFSAQKMASTPVISAC
ncbi:MAG: YciK family oxidoreductase [Gammaproteobacteria bacterium RBG_16_57_12]|nr:MAG: YciK family oxidoreductase [Gammaproteobacteria bacterium RBG_16_57_12]